MPEVGREHPDLRRRPHSKVLVDERSALVRMRSRPTAAPSRRRIELPAVAASLGARASRFGTFAARAARFAQADRNRLLSAFDFLPGAARLEFTALHLVHRALRPSCPLYGHTYDRLSCVCWFFCAMYSSCERWFFCAMSSSCECWFSCAMCVFRAELFLRRALLASAGFLATRHKVLLLSQR